ncbi:MAG: glycoside hydrolase family 3 C-terminal domain-containing protein, partial [Saprospiraceae bacterium]|nr:glycoside hydrolase family 3 C-terminal domain-containing protein [Saprospiraceae bacterium]
LLKNEKNTLPLSKKLKKIAVLGPNANNSIAVLGNYNGTPSKVVNALEGIKTKVGNHTEVVYEKAVDFTRDTLLRYSDLSGQFSWENQKGFKAEYFNNKDLSGKPEAVRIENQIDHIWQEGQEIIGPVRAAHFSARYSASFKAQTNGPINFELEGDDGYRFFINGKEVLNAWQRNRWGPKVYTLTTRKDSIYQLVIEYWQGEGSARLHLRAGHYEKSDFNAIVQQFSDVDAFIFIGGISPQLEGEEMQVNYKGFNGGDRTTILLPEAQTALLKALHKTGKPVIFVMMTGSAIAIPWEDANLPAIVNAWYGGQSAGTALADVLFGDYNPAGRLPVTFYKSDADLPDFKHYDMSNRTYRYFKGEALYPFGYGLSYSAFKYSKLSIPRSVEAGKDIRVSVTVTNTGKMAGEEVAQLYLSYPGVTGKAPIRALKGFHRVGLQPGESKILTFILTPEELSLVQSNGKPWQPKGKATVSIGGGQPDIKRKTSGNVLKKQLEIL